MLRDGLLLFYSAAVGFVAAGIAASFFKMVTAAPARFALLGEGWLGAAATLVFCGLTGPAIIVDRAIRDRLAGRNGMGRLFASLFMAAAWSACSGILVLQIALSLGGVVA